MVFHIHSIYLLISAKCLAKRWFCTHFSPPATDPGLCLLWQEYQFTQHWPFCQPLCCYTVATCCRHLCFVFM